MEFTRVFASILENEHLNQTELARSLHVSKQAITNLKKGISFPSLELLCAIAGYFNVSTDYLLGLEDEFGNKIYSNTEKKE